MGESDQTVELGALPAAATDELFAPVDRERLRQVVRARVFGDAGSPLRIGRYEVLRELGSGGMGIVYEAHDESLDRKLAIKVVGYEGDQIAHDRLEQEARALARLSHPNVVQVHDVGQWEGQVFLAMELISGRTLQRWQIEDNPSWREIVARYREAAAGLAAAHAVGIVHRDFKPANALLGWDGRVRVLDFGLARPEAHSGSALPGPDLRSDLQVVDPVMTKTGVVLGTPAYMAPEQAEGGEIDASVDQFAFGVALFEALYGHRPFDGDSIEALQESIRTQTVRFPASGGNVPARLRRVLLRLLQPDPARRFSDMDRVVDALDRITRRRGWATLGVVGAVAALGGLATLQAREPIEHAGAPAQAAETQAILHGDVEAQRTRRQADAMTLTAAREVVAEDPSRAVAMLGELSPQGWNPAARALAVEARSRGIATDEWPLPPRTVALMSPKAAAIAAWDNPDREPAVLDLSTGELVQHDDNAMFLTPHGNDTLFYFGFVPSRFGFYDVEDREFQWLPSSMENFAVGMSRSSSTHVAFLYKEELRIFGADGSSRAAEAPTASPKELQAATGGAAWLLEGSGRLHYLGPSSTEMVELSEGITEAEFSPAGDRIIALTTTGELRGWTLDAEPIAHRLTPPPDPRRVVLSPSGEQIATWSGDGSIYLSSWSEGAPPRAVGHTKGARPPQLQFSADGRHLVSIANKSQLQVIELASDDAWAPWGDFAIANAAITPDGEHVVGFVVDQGIKRWRLDFTQARTIHETNSWINAVVIVDNDTLYIGSHDGVIRRIHVGAQTSQDVLKTTGIPEGLFATTDRLAVIDTGGHLKTVDTADGAQTTLAEHGVKSAAISDAMIAWTDGAQVHRWDSVQREFLAPLPCEGCEHVVFSTDGSVLAAGPRGPNKEHSIARWEPHTGIEDNPLGPLTKKFETFTLLGDGHEAVIINRRGTARVLSSAGLGTFNIPEPGDAWSNITAGGNGLVLLVSEGGSPLLWDPKTNVSQAVARPIDPATFVAAVSPDGRQIAGGVEDGRVIVWRDQLPGDGESLRAWAKSATNVKWSSDPSTPTP